MLVLLEVKYNNDLIVFVTQKECALLSYAIYCSLINKAPDLPLDNSQPLILKILWSLFQLHKRTFLQYYSYFYIHLRSFLNVADEHSSQMANNWFIFLFILRNDVEQRNPIKGINKREVCQSEFIKTFIFSPKSLEPYVCKNLQ